MKTDRFLAHYSLLSDRFLPILTSTCSIYSLHKLLHMSIPFFFLIFCDSFCFWACQDLGEYGNKATNLARNIEPSMGSSMEKAACRVNNPFQNEGYYSDWNFDAALRLDVGQVAYSLNDGEHRAIAAGFIQ